MKRIILILSVAALMAGIMVASVSPAFATKQGQTMACINGSALTVFTSNKQVIKDLER
jgi:hypothetical protein